MAVDENYLDNLLKNANEKEEELEQSIGTHESASDRVRAFSQRNPGAFSVFSEPEPVVEPEPEIQAEPEIVSEPISEAAESKEEPRVAANLTPEEIAAIFAPAEALAAEEPAPIEVTPVSDDSNAAMTPEQIAAMFASVEVPAEEPVVEPVIEEPVIGPVAEEPVIEPVAEEPAPIEVTPVSDDPNAAMTPEQIAAMFASVETPAEEPVIEEPVVEEPIIEPVAEEPAPIEVTPVSDDPNAAMTPEQIAAMFASVETPAEEPVIEEPAVEPVIEEPVIEPVAEEPVIESVAEEPAPIEVTPVSDDPNAAMTPEQIAAMFASVEAPAEEPVIEEPTVEPVVEEPVIESVAEEPAPIEVTPVSDDPNAAMTPEQIAAMFASVDTPAEEPAVEPVIEEPVIEPVAEEPVIEPVAEEPAPIEVTPVSDDPNAAMTPEQIAAMFASVEAPAEEPAVEEPAVEEPVIAEPVTEEPAPIEVTPVSDDPNASMTPEQIAAMFASVEAPAEEPVVEEPAVEEPVIEPVAEELAPIEVTPVSDDPNAAMTPEQIASLFAAAETPEEAEAHKDELTIEEIVAGASLDDFVPPEDANVNEIEELLSMSDNHELVDAGDEFDIFAGSNADGEMIVDEMDIDSLLENADTVHKRTASLEDDLEDIDSEDDESEDKPKKKRAKKEKKPRVKKEKKTKKSRKSKKEQSAEDDTIDISIDADMDGENDEDAAKPKKGIGAWFKKFVDALTEEEEDEPVDNPDEPERAAGSENMAILGELDREQKSAEPAGKKGKKEKKNKKDDPKAKAKEEEAKKKKEEAAKKKAEKKKAAAEAKAQKKAAKEEKEKALGPIKKLPKKKVILIFGVFIPILACLLAIGILIPADQQLKEARTAYVQKDYDVVYRNLYGQKLSETDEKIYENSTAALQMRRWMSAYSTYSKVDMPREALDALFNGVTAYNYISSNLDISDVSGEVETTYQNILMILNNVYGVDEQMAQMVVASDTNRIYTRYVDGILANMMPGQYGSLNNPVAEENIDTSQDFTTEGETADQEYWDDIYNQLTEGDELQVPSGQAIEGGFSGDIPVEGSGDALIYEIHAQ